MVTEILSKELRVSRVNTCQKWSYAHFSLEEGETLILYSHSNRKSTQVYTAQCWKQTLLEYVSRVVHDVRYMLTSRKIKEGWNTYYTMSLSQHGYGNILLRKYRRYLDVGSRGS